jgi:hypothetical protein
MIYGSWHVKKRSSRHVLHNAFKAQRQTWQPVGWYRRLAQNRALGNYGVVKVQAFKG